MSKWEMGYSSTLEQRAKKNNRDIDMQWIKENEANEFFNNSNSNLLQSDSNYDPFAKWPKPTKTSEELQKEIDDLLAQLDIIPTTSEARHESIKELKDTKKDLEGYKKSSSFFDSLKSNKYGGGNPLYGSQETDFENQEIKTTVDEEFERILAEIHQASEETFKQSSGRGGR